MNKKIRADGVSIYWEPQVAGLCGVHCVNTLLQSPVVSAVDLAEIAQGLDAQERVAMAEEGVESADFLKFLAEDSGNVAGDGNFSVQVLSEALKVWNLDVVSVNSPDAKDAKANPLAQNAFILNLGSHWFTVRRIGGVFWNLNSLNKAGPEEVGDFYLALLFDTLMQEGYSIFVIIGDMPDFHQNMRNDSFSSGGGKWVTCVPKSMGGGRPMQHNTSETDLSDALSASLMDVGEDDEMAAAIAASLAGVSDPPGVSSPGGGEDDQRALALSRALSAPEPEKDGVTLMIRLRDGSTLKRSFGSDVSVDLVYDFVVGSSVSASMKGVLRDTVDKQVQYPRSNKTLRESFGSTKRVALMFE